MRRRPRCSRARRGALLIEFALVFPLMIVMVVAIIEYGFLMTMRNWVTDTARDKARTIAISTPSQRATLDVPGIIRAPIQRLGFAGLKVDEQKIKVLRIKADGTEDEGWQSAQAGDLIVLEIPATYTPVSASLLIPNSLPASARSTVPSE